MSYEQLLELPGEVVATARTRLTRRVEIDGRRYYLKTQRFPRRLRYFLRPSAYVREARAFRRMAAAGIRVPEVAAVGERRRLGFLRDALILTAEVPDAIDLAAWEAEGGAPRPGLPSVGEFRAELFDLVRRVQDRGFRFGDLKPRNVLAAPADEDGAHVVILDQRRFHRCRLRIHSRARDLRFLAEGATG